MKLCGKGIILLEMQKKKKKKKRERASKDTERSKTEKKKINNTFVKVCSVQEQKIKIYQ